jgi:hypothetical protein
MKSEQAVQDEQEREPKKLTRFSLQNVVVAAQYQGEDRKEEQEAAQDTGLQSRGRASVRRVSATVLRDAQVAQPQSSHSRGQDEQGL